MCHIKPVAALVLASTQLENNACKKEHKIIPGDDHRQNWTAKSSVLPHPYPAKAAASVPGSPL